MWPHSFFRGLQFKCNVFLFDSTTFSNYFFNVFLMRLVCCSHWPTWPCSVIQTFFPPCSCLKCHTQHVTVLTSTHLSPYTTWTLQWMWMGGIFSSVKNSTARYLNRTSSQLSISTGTETQLWIAVSSRLRMIRRRCPLSAWNRLYPVFFIRIKIMTEKEKLFQPVRIYGGSGIRGCRRDSSSILAQDRVYWQACHIVLHKRRKISSRAAWLLVSVKGPWSIRLVMPYKEIKLVEWIRSTLKNKKRKNSCYDL
jgi:hypothetical protein